MMVSVAQRLGTPLPETELTVRFHPSVESYQRATGQPWWTAGSRVEGRVELLPLPVLEARGQLERTVRHELVHVLTAAALEDRPMWVKEGVARYFAAPDKDWESTAAGASCPSDREYDRVDSGESLRALHDRAASCVAARLDHRRAWRELP
jgi:hypothetical protein